MASIHKFNLLLFVPSAAPGSAVVEALRYKLKGCGIDYQWSHWNFSLT
jgi:hypothetical protein